MIAIQTRFHGPTNTRGSRYSAQVMEGPVRRIIKGADDRLDSRGNHDAAARALIEKLGWRQGDGYGPWHCGSTADGYVYVCETGIASDRL